MSASTVQQASGVGAAETQDACRVNKDTWGEGNNIEQARFEIKRGDGSESCRDGRLHPRRKLRTEDEKDLGTVPSVADSS